MADDIWGGVATVEQCCTDFSWPKPSGQCTYMNAVDRDHAI